MNHTDPLSLALDRATTTAAVLDLDAYGRSDKTLRAEAYMLDPVPCLGCKLLTYGCFSVGGHHLRAVCRPCKDAADKQEERRVTAFVRALDMFSALPARREAEEPEPEYLEADGPCTEDPRGHDWHAGAKLDPDRD